VNDFVETQLDRITSGTGLMVDALNKGNFIFDQVHDVAKQQIEIFAQQVIAIEKRNKILQNCKPRVYTRAYV